MSVIPEVLRREPKEATEGRSVRALAGVPGRVTVGLAGFGTLSVAGVSVAGVAREPVAVAVTRLERRGDRMWGVPCRGVGPVQNLVRTGYSLGANKGGVYEFVNPFSADWIQVKLWGDFDRSGGLDMVPPLPEGTRQVSPPLPPNWPVPRLISSRTVSLSGYIHRDETWEVPRGTIFKARGGLYGVSFTLVFYPAELLYDWRPAVAGLAWAGAGTGLPWWGSIEATARAGVWVRRVSWEDWARRVRYVAGAGTARAVAVDQSGAVLTPESFGGAEWLATDWQVVGTAEPMPVDVTDWVFAGPPDAVAWAVEGSATPGESTGPESPSDGVDGVPPSSGDYVRMSRDGVAQWVPVQMFACPVE